MSRPGRCKHKFKRIGFTLLTGLVLISCKNNHTDSKHLEVLTLRGPSAMSMLHMIGEFTELDDFSVSHIVYDEPLQIRAKMLREEPEMALIPTNMAANLFNKGVPYKLAAISIWGTLEVFGNDPSISTWEDLRGKRVHLMAKGMTPDILFRFLAVQNNLDPDNDLILDYSFPTHSDLANAVIAGLADISVLSEPLVTMVRNKNPSVETIFNLETEWKKVFNEEFAIPQTSLVVRSSFADENHDLVRSYIEKYMIYCQKVVDNPEKAAPLAVSNNILPDILTAVQSIPGCNMRVEPSWLVKEKVYEYLKVFYNFNPESIGGRVPDETFFFEK